jgi:hypothetical protein
MKILREGDVGVALAPGRGKVSVVYRYQDYDLDSGVRVKNVLVGIDPETEEVLTVPAQSTAKIKAARSAKDQTVEARISAELQDVIALIAVKFDSSPQKVGPAVVRYYIGKACESPRLERRLKRLSGSPLARLQKRVAWKVRMRPEYASWLGEVACADLTVTPSDIIRGILVAAKEDVLDQEATSARKSELEAAALAV